MDFSETRLSSIRNILTLRYDPENSPFLPLKRRSDFVGKNSDENGVTTEKILEESLREKLSIYDKICVANSGGLDSLLLLVFLKKTFPKKKIFSVTLSFHENNAEFEHAKVVAQKYDVPYFHVKCKSILDSMEDLVSINNQPRWNTYLSFVTKKAKELGDVLVTGDGADEIFAGYDFRYSKFLKLDETNQVKRYLMCHERDWVVDQQKMFGKQINFKWNKIFSYFKKFFDNELDPLKQVLLADYNGKLIHDILPTNNMISNFFGLPIISPFISSNLVDNATHLPISELYNGKEGKIILKKILKRNKVLVTNKKIGFGPNLKTEWAVNFEKYKRMILDANCHIYKKQLIDYEWVKNSLSKISDIRYASKLTLVYALEKWLSRNL